MSKESVLDVVVVGAGPYGISLGLHLKSRGVTFRVFGPPMKTWLDTMPKGMDLKSEGYASTISDPSGRTLETYSDQRGLPYEAVGLPVPLKVFQEYGLDAHSRLGENADLRLVVGVFENGGTFKVVLSDGEEMTAKRVVIAAGISHFAHIPEQFKLVPSELVSHSSEHSDVSVFKGKRLGVVGAGASAIDLAVLAAEAGAEVTMICRNGIKWNERRIEPRPLYERIRLPESCMGPGLRSCLYEKWPLGFKTLPTFARDRIAREFAGPSGGWTVHERFEQAVSYLTETQVDTIQEKGGKLALDLMGSGGERRILEVDQLICATGYKTDLEQLRFIDETVRKKVAKVVGSPVLDTNFESTARGLYFVGKASAVTFGPLMRFVCGTGYAAKRLSRHLAV